MIRTARDKRVWSVLDGKLPKRFPADIVRATQRRLVALDAAVSIEELRSPPSNRLEVLRGDRAGWHSIRINRQWRICFRWVNNNAEDVEIVDYH
jgi:toxin HigB-1